LKMLRFLTGFSRLRIFDSPRLHHFIRELVATSTTGPSVGVGRCLGQNTYVSFAAGPLYRGLASLMVCAASPSSAFPLRSDRRIGIFRVDVIPAMRVPVPVEASHFITAEELALLAEIWADDRKELQGSRPHRDDGLRICGRKRKFRNKSVSSIWIPLLSTIVARAHEPMQVGRSMSEKTRIVLRRFQGYPCFTRRGKRLMAAAAPITVPNFVPCCAQNCALTVYRC